MVLYKNVEEEENRICLLDSVTLKNTRQLLSLRFASYKQSFITSDFELVFDELWFLLSICKFQTEQECHHPISLVALRLQHVKKLIASQLLILLQCIIILTCSAQFVLGYVTTLDRWTIPKTSMEPPISDPEKIKDQKEGGPSFHCNLYDTELVHKIAQVFLPGLATACVDNTTGDIFRSPGSVAAEIRKEMIEYLTRRSETFVAEHIVLDGGGSEIESSHDPYDIISDFIDDFATSKRNLFSRVSGWLLSERREDNIDDFAQEMAISGFWLTDQREGISQTLLKNVDFKNTSHCEMKFKTEGELTEHTMVCGYRTMNCENEGCNAVFCTKQMENHDSVCPFKIIPCEQNCSESIMRREMDRHCITVCTMKLVSCPFHGVGCVSNVHQCELQQHLFDNVSSHLMYILRSIYKEASLDDLKPRAEKIQQLSTRLSEARNARALTNLVKEIDAKLGPLEIKSKNSTDSETDKPENTEKKAEIIEKSDTSSLKASSLEQTTREPPEDTEAVKKVSEAEIADEEVELKAEKLLEIDEFIKEGDKNSDLSDKTETKAPEVVIMDEESEETKHSRINETRGLEIEVKDMVNEENRETEKSTETEAPLIPVMEKKEDEEGIETVNLRGSASGEVEALSKSLEGFSKEQVETEPNLS